MGQFEEYDEKSSCQCCYDEKDQSGQIDHLKDKQSRADYQQPDNHSNNASDNQTNNDDAACHKGCVACCHEFDHQFCADPEACRTSINHPNDQSISLLVHNHTGLRQRFVYKKLSAKSDVFSLASPSKIGSTTDLVRHSATDGSINPPADSVSAYKKLSFIDRFLSLWILLAMVVGVLVGYYSSDATDALQSVHLGSTSVSLPVAFGLWFMMWPVLVKVKYETFVRILHRRDIWKQLGFSLAANWVRE